MKKLSFLMLIMLMINFILANPQQVEEKKQKHMKPVLVVIDIQNKYIPYMSEEDRKFGLEMINYAIMLFRQNGFPIIRVYHTDPEWGPKPDTEDFEFPKTVAIKDEDAKIIKNYANAFKKTELEKLIREQGHNTLFLCGLSAVGCVLATYHGAQDLDLNVFMVKDALLSHNSTYTDYVEEIFDTVSLTTLKVMLEYTQK